MRIVSLVPSITELLFDLNLQDEVVGITKFCVHPESWFRSKTRVGGTKTVHLDRVLALQPDLVIANKEENTKEDISFLQEHVPVLLTEIYTVTEALNMMETIGLYTHREQEAKHIIDSIRNEYASFPVKTRKRALYLIWQDPIMVAGTDTFIHAMMQVAGFDNLCEGTRYPEVTIEEIKQLNPEVILLSSEPFPFKEKHRAVFLPIFPDTDIRLVDGEIFSWYGSRMLQAIPYFRSLNEA